MKTVNVEQANKETKITLSGRVFNFRFGMKAMMLLEQEHDINVFEFGEGNFSPSKLAKVLYAGLYKEHHHLTFDQLIELLDSEDLPTIVKLIQGAFESAMSDSSVDQKKAIDVTPTAVNQ